MEYKGKLYGKVGEMVFPLLHTTDDWEKMEKRIIELQEKIQLPSDREIDAMFPFLDNNSNRQRDSILNKRKGAKQLRDFLQKNL